MDRRRFVIGTAATALAAGPAFAQEAYPSRAVTIINAFPPGGLNDIVTRPLAAALEPILKQPVVIETKAGAAGQVGAQVAASAKPDGYTLLSHNTGISGYAEVDKLFGRPVKTTRADFIPLARMVADPVLLLVNDQQPYKTLKEFIDGAKAKSGHARLQLGRPLWREPPAAGVSGEGDGPVEAASSADQRRRPGHRRHPRQQCPGHDAIGVGDAARTSRPASCARWPSSARRARRPLPDVPTLKELGYDVEYYLWVGIFAPKGTPPAIVTTLRDAIGKAVQSDQFKTALANAGQELDYLDGPDFQKFWDIDGKRTDDAVISIGRQG